LAFGELSWPRRAASVAAGLVPAYLFWMSQSSPFGSKGLPETASGVTAPGVALQPRKGVVAIFSLFAALALGGSVLLWAHYGTTVFFETIRAGFAACFG
jgi:hypothetical protein